MFNSNQMPIKGEDVICQGGHVEPLKYLLYNCDLVSIKDHYDALALNCSWMHWWDVDAHILIMIEIVLLL